MAAVAAALLYALLVWWVSTGLVLLLVLRGRRALVLAGAALLVPLCLAALVASAQSSGVAGAYVAFTAAIGLWGTQEIGFLAGVVTGPRPLPCPPQAQGVARFAYALGAIAYHELALLAAGVLVLAATWNGPNQVGVLTFAVLWVMRISAELNLFLGVPVLNDEMLPAPIAFVRSYFARGPVSGFFPVALVGSVLGLCALVIEAADPDASKATTSGYVLVAALMGLAIVEHLFMLVPLPIDRLWAWSTCGRRAGRASAPPRDVPAGEIERIAAGAP